MKRDKIIDLIDMCIIKRNYTKIGILLFMLISGSLLNSISFGAKISDWTPIEKGDWTYTSNAESWWSYNPEYLNYKFPSNSVLYTKIPASETYEDRDVCIYLTNEGAQEYLDKVNAERASWGLNPVSYSQDLEEGSMLRAGEWLESYYRDQTLGPHETYKFPAPTYESTFGTMDEYNSLTSFDAWMREKPYLPTGYTPQANGYIAENGRLIGHYTSMVVPEIKYIGQGGAFSDINCDGLLDYKKYNATGGVVPNMENTYYQEYSTSSEDLYPDLNSIVTGSYTPTPTYSSNNSSSTVTNVNSNTNVVSNNVNTSSRVDESIEKEKLAQEKAAEKKKLKEQQEQEFEAKQKENEDRREKEALLNDKTHKHRDDEVLTTAGNSHFVAMMMWALIISVVYFIGSKLLYLRNK